MNQPLTDEQAEEKHRCSECKELPGAIERLKEHLRGNVPLMADLNMLMHAHCPGDCVEGQTTSTRCKQCDERIWFTYDGFLPPTFDCPYCGEKTTNRYAEQHNDFEAIKRQRV